MPSGSWIHISGKPQGSAAGSRMMGTPAAASRACSAWTSGTWTQLAECFVPSPRVDDLNPDVTRRVPLRHRPDRERVTAVATWRRAGPPPAPSRTRGPDRRLTRRSTSPPHRHRHRRLPAALSGWSAVCGRSSPDVAGARRTPGRPLPDLAGPAVVPSCQAERGCYLLGNAYAREPGKSIIKARSGPRQLPPANIASAAQGPDFFIRTRTGTGKTLRPKDGENPRESLLSHRDLPSMTDHRVPHLVRLN
jgi:hypothetical protein